MKQVKIYLEGNNNVVLDYKAKIDAVEELTEVIRNRRPLVVNSQQRSVIIPYESISFIEVLEV